MTDYTAWGHRELVVELRERDALKPALRRVLDYSVDDEARHWAELGQPKEHIYVDMLALARLVSTPA